MGTIYIETDRLILRDWTDADRKPFAELNGNPDVMRFFPSCLTPKESDAFVGRIITEIQDNGYGLYAVELKDSGEFIGFTDSISMRSFLRDGKSGGAFQTGSGTKDMRRKLQRHVLIMPGKTDFSANCFHSQPR